MPTATLVYSSDRPATASASTIPPEQRGYLEQLLSACRKAGMQTSLQGDHIVMHGAVHKLNPFTPIGQRLLEDLTAHDCWPTDVVTITIDAATILTWARDTVLGSPIEEALVFTQHKDQSFPRWQYDKMPKHKLAWHEGLVATWHSNNHSYGVTFSNAQS